MRADAQKNYDHILAVAREAFAGDGANASLRDIARRAGVGLGTLYRHFETREALLEALLRTSFERLTARAHALGMAPDPAAALVTWLREIVALTHDYSGVIATMVAAIEDETSALHTACVGLKSAGAELLARAQEAGSARRDIDGTDFFALISALAWLRDQPPFAARADHVLDIVTDAILSKTSLTTTPDNEPGKN